MRLIHIARGIVGLWFAARLAMMPDGSWDRMFTYLADYLMIDGVLAFLVAGLWLREGVAGGMKREYQLGAVLLVDAVGRTASGVAVHVWPGIPGFPVTAVLFIGIMAACTAMVGVTEGRLIIDEEIARHGPRHDRPQLTVLPLTVASIASVIFGVVAFLSVGEPSRVQVLLTWYVFAAALAMLAIAWARQESKRAPTTPSLSSRLPD